MPPRPLRRKMRPWKKPSAPLFAAIGAGVIVALLFVSYMLSSGLLNRREGVPLPPTEWDVPIVSAGGQVFTAQSVADVQITVANVRQVIASLKRAETYSCRVENTLYYADGSASLYCRQYVRKGVVRTDTVSASGAVQSTLLRKDDTIYVWEPGDWEPYKGRQGDFSDDAAAMLPAYEDVLQENTVLLEAGSVLLDGDVCIRATFERDGYRCVYDISAAAGILRQAAFYTGDTLNRLVRVTELDTQPPDGEYFTLPDGESILED